MHHKQRYLLLDRQHRSFRLEKKYNRNMFSSRKTIAFSNDSFVGHSLNMYCHVLGSANRGIILLLQAEWTLQYLICTVLFSSSVRSFTQICYFHYIHLKTTSQELVEYIFRSILNFPVKFNLVWTSNIEAPKRHHVQFVVQPYFYFDQQCTQ